VYILYYVDHQVQLILLILYNANLYISTFIVKIKFMFIYLKGIPIDFTDTIVDFTCFWTTL